MKCYIREFQGPEEATFVPLDLDPKGTCFGRCSISALIEHMQAKFKFETDEGQTITLVLTENNGKELARFHVEVADQKRVFVLI